MKWIRKIATALLAGLCLAAGAENLLLSPETEAPLKGWSSGNGVQLEAQNGTLSVVIDGGGCGVSRKIALNPEWKWVSLSMKMRTENLKPGKDGWRNGRLAMRFHDKNGKGTGPWPEVFGFSGNTQLRNCVRLYEIPAGAVMLEVSPANFGVSGRVEFKEMKLEPVSDLKQLKLDADSPDGSPKAKLWDVAEAFRIVTPTRETICLNGLWNFFPVSKAADAAAVPQTGAGWGWFKVPGIWPGMGWGDNQPGDNSAIVLSPFASAGFNPAKLNTAWYRRTVAVPADWKGRAVSLDISMLQTCAQVYVDGKRAGELYYPGGKVDLTAAIKPGTTQELALLVSAKNDEAVGSVFMAPGRLVKTSGKIMNRGITGDMFLTAEPRRAAISDVHVITSWRAEKITCDVGVEHAEPGTYRLEAEIFDGDSRVLSFRSRLFSIKDGEKSRRKFSKKWLAPKLWDIDTPENLYTAKVRLVRENGAVADEFFPQTFGFREFWCEGRNFMLNGSVIHLRSTAVSSVLEGSARASREVLEQVMRRAKSMGFNHLISYNYSFAPGVVGYQESLYREAAKAGILMSLSMPHPAHFNWALDTPEERKRYLEQSEFLIRRFQNNPAIVLYAATHNAAGYFADQSPLKLDGVYSPDGDAANKERRQALLAGELIGGLDPTRPVYHHESGNLGDVMTLNCYLNWVPAQERSDWLEHWEKEGVKPLMLVEWGLPHTPSWSSFRGPAFIYSGDAKVVQCIWLNEYNAALFGERTYATSPGKEKAYRIQERVSTGNKPVHYIQIFPYRPATLPVCAEKADDNFRSMRARGLSGLLPWDFSLFWKRTGKTYNGPWKKRFENLKQPGIVPDTARGGGTWLEDLNTEYEPTELGVAGLKWLKEKIAWIAGKTGDFTEKGHNFRPGETVRKQVMIVNDSRRTVKTSVKWSVPELKLSGAQTLSVAPGTRAGVPVTFTLPDEFSGDEINLRAKIDFGNGDAAEDSFRIRILPPEPAQFVSRIGVFDPEGKSAELLNKLHVPFRRLDSVSGLNGVDLLILGRGALKRNLPQLAPWLEQGGRLLVLEQTFGTLDRMGFRSTEYGLRKLFPLDRTFAETEAFNWRGSSTLTLPYLKLPEKENGYPSWNWHGFNNTRPWRAGNRGNTVSVPLERPNAGNFLALMQGGFDLQYAPALEAKAGKGIAIFSQFDITGRTEPDPEAGNILLRMLGRLDKAEAAPELPTRFAGNAELEKLLKSALVSAQKTDPVPADGVLVVGPGARLPELTGAVKNGLRVLLLGLSGKELEALLPGQFRTTPVRSYSDFAEGLESDPVFRGVSNADLHWRKEVSFDAFDAKGSGGRALRSVHLGKGTAVALQVAPWMFDEKEFQFRTTRRRNTAAVTRLLFNLGAKTAPGIWSTLFPSRTNTSLNIPLAGEWLGKADPRETGEKEKWQTRPADASWTKIKVPGKFEDQIETLKNYDGLFWYKRTFNLPEGVAPESLCTLSLGPVDDESWAWVNGQFVGEVTQKTNPSDYWAAQRFHSFRGTLLHAGENEITVLCRDLRGKGGILGSPVLRAIPPMRFYTQEPVSSDDPFRYFRW